MQKLFLSAMLLTATLSLHATDYTVKSPDSRLVVTLSDTDGKLTYAARYDGHIVVLPSALGLTTDVDDFTRQLTVTQTRDTLIDRSYTMTRIKKEHIHYVAHGLALTVRTPKKNQMTVRFLVSNNNVAYRYELPLMNNGETQIIKVYSEASSFRFPEHTTTFLSPQITPMTGWKRSKPSYEEEYVPDAPMATKSKFGVGYTFPCLFKIVDGVASGESGKKLARTNEYWVLVSETGVTSQYCGSRLSDYAPATGYTVAFPQAGENNGVGSAEPAMGLPNQTPWRTLTIGSTLAPVVETTVPYDVVEPLYAPKTQYRPGRYTWSWLIWQDNSANYDDQVRFIDLAAKMGYEYCLVDALWDTQIGYQGIERLANYAKRKNVRLLLWYNSNGMQNDAPQGPRNVMSNTIARKREMAWLNSIGVAGIKVDFFGGDKQATMKLYEDILSDANDYGLQVIFHGCTLPRGWERMYPNYVASEAALASENVFFSEHHANREGFEMTMHPFCRNAVGSFDWGGVIMNHYLSKDNKSRHARKTTDIFELATAITNQTSVNCVAVTPNVIDEVPAAEQELLRQLPTTWSDTRFVAGYPTRYAVIARQDSKSGHWYVGGLNGTDKAMTLTLQLPMLAGKRVKVYCDAPRKALEPVGSVVCDKQVKTDGSLKVTLQPMGGLVVVE